MSATVASGRIEQAIYSWSKHNLSGSGGQGFTEVSPGLRDEVPWLEGLDLRRLRPFDEALVAQADGYEGWKRLVTIGAMSAGELTVVYRKIASAGSDRAKRNRFVSHLLVGNAAEFDLSSIARDDPHWLGAEEIPLDKPPKLSSLKIDDLTPRGAGHDCAVCDAVAREFLQRLISEPDGLHAAKSFPVAEPASVLLTAVPTALWPFIDLTWWVGSEGPVFVAGAAGRPDAGAASTVARAGRAGLSDCAFHARVDQLWDGLAPSERSWEGFVTAFAATRAARPKGAAPTPGSPREELMATIAAAIGVTHWDGSGDMSDSQVLRVLGAVEKLPAASRDLVGQLSADELRAVLGGIESNGGFSRAIRFFEKTGVAGGTLETAWRETGIAVLGLALLSRDSSLDPVGSWAVPARVDARELEKLVRYLLRNEPGLDRIARLLNAGFAASPRARKDIVAALTAAGATPQRIFAQVLPRAELAAPTLADFVRENIEIFAAWRGLSEPYVDALRIGLTTPRRRFGFGLLPFLRGADWRVEQGEAG